LDLELSRPSSRAKSSWAETANVINTATVRNTFVLYPHLATAANNTPRPFTLPPSLALVSRFSTDLCFGRPLYHTEEARYVFVHTVAVPQIVFYKAHKHSLSHPPELLSLVYAFFLSHLLPYFRSFASTSTSTSHFLFDLLFHGDSSMHYVFFNCLSIY
jgi:hypothetical protein